MEKNFTRVVIFAIAFVVSYAVTAVSLMAYLSLVSASPAAREAATRPLIQWKKTPITANVAPPVQPPVTMLFVGDIMLGRYVESLMKKNGDDYAFEQIHDFLIQPRDVVFGNLEGPIVEHGQQTPNYSTRFSFNENTGTLLKSHGFTIVSLANNHTYDFGDQGWDDTKKYLTDALLEFIGHPREVGQEYVVTKNVQGQPVIFVTLHLVFKQFDAEKTLGLIDELVATTPNAFIIVSPHWGIEYKLISNSVQQDIAHQLIDHGVDLVIGHHPHVVQEAELYNGRMIFYSLGNFIFDQYFSRATQEGLTVELSLDALHVSYTLQPVKIVKSQPVLMEGDEKKKWLEELAKRSRGEILEQIKNGEVEIPRL